MQAKAEVDPASTLLQTGHFSQMNLPLPFGECRLNVAEQTLQAKAEVDRMAQLQMDRSSLAFGSAMVRLSDTSSMALTWLCGSRSAAQQICADSG